MVGLYCMDCVPYTDICDAALASFVNESHFKFVCQRFCIVELYCTDCVQHKMT